MRILMFSLIWLIATELWAHGEDKPGPHNGFISMPGAFHVELVPSGSHQLKVYLLDLQWRNPTVRDSAVDLMYGNIRAKCSKGRVHFVCEFPRTVDLNKTGELVVNATREKQQGTSLTHSLPLKLKTNH